MNKTFRAVLVKGVNVAESIHNAILNSRIVQHAARSLVGHACHVLEVLADQTERHVRLYSLEGRHLSHRKGMLTRMTWYTNPTTAIDIGEYMGGLTGRLVYVDLWVNVTSPYSYRHYKRGDAAYTLQGELMAKAKRNWKYVKANDLEVATGRE